MTSEYQQTVKKYFLKYKRLLKLNKAWKVEIKINPDIKEYANVEWFYPSKIFIININPEKNQTLDNLRDSIIHECVHILLSPMTAELEVLFAKVQNKQTIPLSKTQKQFEKVEEAIVCRLSDILFNLMKGHK